MNQGDPVVTNTKTAIWKENGTDNIYNIKLDEYGNDNVCIVTLTDNDLTLPESWSNYFGLISGNLDNFIAKYITNNETYRGGKFSGLSGGRRRSTKKARKTRRRSKK
jgi:hypothetical protein